MQKITILCLMLVFGATLGYAAAVKDDPGKLPDNQLAQYINMKRNLDRCLQQGQYGLVIKNGKKLLKDFVKEDAYGAFCIAAAYASIEPDPEGEEDTVAHAVEYLDKAIEWGFRNVQILKTSNNFDFLRENDEFKSIVKYLEKTNAKEEAMARRSFPQRIKKQVERAKPKALDLGGKDINGKALDDKALSGKPIFLVVLRPGNRAVTSALPAIKEIAAAAKEKGVAMLGVVYNYKYSARLTKEAQKFVADNKIPFPCMPVERAWAKKYGVLNLPSLILVNKKGEALYTRNGVQEAWRLEALLKIAADL